MRSGRGLGDGDARVHVEGQVVVHRTVTVEHATVPVVGVLVDAQVGHQHHPVADLVGQVGEGQLDDPVRVERLAADGVLGWPGRRTA